MKTHKFARKPFYVDAVRVSETNIEEVAAWCESEIKTDSDGKRYIHIPGVYRPAHEKQTQAYIGDWVLMTGTGFKIYVPKAFDRSFEKVKYLTRAQADEAGITVPHEKSQAPERAVKRPKEEVEDEGIDVTRLPIPTPSIMKKQDGVTGKDATVFTPPEDLVDPPQSKADEEADRLLAEVNRLRRA